MKWVNRLSLVLIGIVVLNVICYGINGLVVGVGKLDKASLEVQANLSPSIFDNQYEESVKLINHSDKTVYNITIENLCRDYEYKNANTIYIDKLEPGQQVLKNFLLLQQEKNEESISVSNTNYTFVWILLLICCLIMLISSLRKYYRKELTFFGLILILYTIYFGYCDYKSLCLDTRFINIQELELTDKDISVTLNCYYTMYDKKFIDLNNNDIPDCLDFNDIYKDTDGDGLSDWQELTLTNTNIFSKYTYDGYLDTEYDSDGDGLSNSTELIIGSNALFKDTDGDGLDDFTEMELGTDLLEVDTDKDGLEDALEIEYGYDPISYDNQFKVEFSSVIKDIKFIVNAVGDGKSIQDFEIRSVDNNCLLSKDVPGYIGEAFECRWKPELDLAVNSWDSEKNSGYYIYRKNIEIARGRKNPPGLLDKILSHIVVDDLYDSDVVSIGRYVLDGKYTNGEPELVIGDITTKKELNSFLENKDYLFSEPVKIIFEFDEQLLSKDGFEPCIYYYDEETQLLQELETELVDNIASTTVSHFSSYILLDKTEYEQIKDECVFKDGSMLANDILFLLDLSYSRKESEELNYRTEIINKYASGLRTDDLIGIYSFKKHITKELDFTNNTAKILQTVNSLVVDTGDTEDSGTDYLTALFTSLNAFKDNNEKNKYILLMTDGMETEYCTDINEVVRLARRLNVKINTIGVGAQVNESVLQSLSNATGGVYVRLIELTDMGSILEVSETMQTSIYDRAIDSNQDELSDYYTNLLISSALKTGTGINLDFSNIDLSSDDWDEDGVINGKEIKVVEREDGTCYVYLYSNPLIEDTDGDGILDDTDTAPFQKGYLGGIVGELAIVANASALNFGHAYLTYESFVKDELDISGYEYRYSRGKSYIGDKLVTTPNQLYSFGNFADDGSTLDILLSGVYTDLETTEGGIIVNLELTSTRNYTNEARVYSALVTQDSVDRLIKYLKDNDYYNVYNHNCTTVAAGAWNETFRNTVELKRFDSKTFSYYNYWKVLFNLNNIIRLERFIKDNSLFESHLDLPIKLKNQIDDDKLSESMRRYIYNYSVKMYGEKED